MVLDELEQECQEKINENMAYALQYMDSYDYRMNLGKLKKRSKQYHSNLWTLRYGQPGNDIGKIFYPKFWNRIL